MAATTMAEAATSDERRWTRLFAALIAALLLLRLVALALNGTDLFFDEAQYWSWSLEPAFGYYSKPPLIAWLIGLATSACGPSEMCVRLPSPLVHTGTAVAIFLLGRQLYGARTGAIAGLAFATLPGVSLSAGIISTDVPLLFFWAVALLALVHLADSRAWWPGVLLGLALGLGLNAKYAMAWFLVCLAVYLWAEPARRALLKDARLYLALGLAALMIVPNLAWNASHGFATLSHTADNAKWTGPLLNPLRALEFLGTQFGVFGPILFASLIVISVRAWQRGAPAADCLLLSFALPVLVVITLQALLSRAHANWAAVSYVAGTVLVTATLVRELSWRWLTASFAVNGAAALMLVAGTSLAGQAALPFGPDPFARTLGWRELAEAVRGELESARASGKPFGAVLTDERSVTAELLYYMRGEETPVLAWREGARPQDHYELTRPFTGAASEPVLLVALGRDAGAIRSSFENAVVIGRRELPAGPRQLRRVTFHALSGYKPK